MCDSGTRDGRGGDRQVRGEVILNNWYKRCFAEDAEHLFVVEGGETSVTVGWGEGLREVDVAEGRSGYSCLGSNGIN